MKGQPARDVAAAVTGDDPTPAVDPERFQDADEPYPGHWRRNPEPWPDVDPADPGVPAAVQAGLAELPDTWATAIRARDVEGRSAADVAAELGVNERQLRDLVNRGRAELRERIARILDASDGQQ